MNPAEPEAAPDAGSLVVAYRRGWAAPVTALVLALLGGALLLADSPAERLVGGACAIVFGLTAVVLSAGHLRSAPALVLDSRGLIDTASGAPAGFVPWSAVTGLVEQRLRGQRYLSVLVDDPATILARADDGTRAAMQANLVLLDTPVNIPLRPLAVGVAELTCAFALRTPVALPAALAARLPAGTAPRPPAADTDLADLSARAETAGISLPGAYLTLLAEQDGWIGATGSGATSPEDKRPDGDAPDGLRVFGCRATRDLDGVLEATQAGRADGLPDDHVLLGQDNAHSYTWNTTSNDFPILSRSDHSSLAQASTFSDLIVTALQKSSNPLG